MFNPVYAVVHSAGESSRDPNNKFYFIRTFDFERSGLFSFKVKEAWRSTVIGDYSFEEVVDLADEQDFRKYDKEPDITHFGNPTPEQRALDEERRQLRQEGVISNPSGTDAFEYWEPGQGNKPHEIRLSSTGDAVLTDETDGVRFPTLIRSDLEMMTIWMKWFDDETLMYLTSDQCRESVVREKEPETEYDQILLYDPYTKEETLVYQQSTRDTDNCIMGIANYQDQVIVIRSADVLVLDLEGNEQSSFIVPVELSSISMTPEYAYSDIEYTEVNENFIIFGTVQFFNGSVRCYWDEVPNCRHFTPEETRAEIEALTQEQE